MCDKDSTTDRRKIKKKKLNLTRYWLLEIHSTININDTCNHAHKNAKRLHDNNSHWL